MSVTSDAAIVPVGKLAPVTLMLWMPGCPALGEAVELSETAVWAQSVRALPATTRVAANSAPAASVPDPRTHRGCNAVTTRDEAADTSTVAD